ncbi:period circadian protein homolog 3 isoform X1 [Rhinichthys klamathensis goyatoka]|uniref:period circadian protein homolog 3 isoform X1 n=1 Tax=Rhinichthys klamathensis goyatoka TaxID=3034132 RepID=UPI0024B55A2A|nr:period circadian protein homolog 3 isoform X1 [Rhinichthys klamathensis goyatoka]
MTGGDGFPDGEEESPFPGPCVRTVQADRTGGGQDPGESSPGCEESGGEQTHKDVDMNSGHESSSGNDSLAGSRHHRSSANCSPGSTTGSGSTKSSKSATVSSSSSFHSSRHTECSSEQTEHGRGQTHREMMQTVQEMKKRLPSEKRMRSKASTVEALHYALNCVKQVQANSEYYNLLMSRGLKERRDATVCTLEELERITSEHTLKNTDMFVVVYSLASGKVVYASEQASSVLHCKRKFLESAKFVDLLYHQDVNVFYSHTAQPPRLPHWNVGTDNAALFECAQVKSFFCRFRGGKDRDGEMRYCPFRITPYLLKVQGLSGEEPCCLSLAERIISGYEAPRIPMDKRIFSTTHSPGCVFLEVDDRAVPLLGYLPQDLIGSSVLTVLHPDDRQLMLALHRKILKYAGQPPFEHSPIRFRCQNGDYVTLDSSWSSFINPWSRKVAFIIGRHKVRTGPLNEDVFAARSNAEQPIMCEDVKELQAMIHKLFQQPVHNKGSSGYGSLGSNGSHEHYISVASSSDSNGNLWEDSHREPMTLQQFCTDVNKVKNWGQQAYRDSRRKLTPLGPTTAVAGAGFHPNSSQGLGIRNHLKQSLQEARKHPHIPSYQQINCVDSIIRYLESCATSALKRKSESLSIFTSSSSSMSEEEKPEAVAQEDTMNTDEAALEGAGVLDSQVSAGSVTTAAVVGAQLTDLTISTEAMSVVSVTSQCSYSSTIVHVPQPESEVTALEDAPMGSEPTDSAPTPACPAPSTSLAAQEELLLVGLTKEVLSAHTQNEEQQFVDRFRHRILQSPYSSYLQQDNSSMAHSHHRGDVVRPPNKHKRPKPEDSSDSYGSQPGNYWSLPGPTGAPHSSWPSSESSQLPPSNIGFVPPMQTAPYFTVGADQQPMVVQPHQGLQNLQPMTPMMVVLLPSYPMYPGTNGMYLQGMPVAAPGVVPQTPFNMGGFVPPGAHMAHGSPLHGHVPGSTVTGVGMPAGASAEVDSIPTPWFGEDLDAGQPTALFSSSRSSSPIQLNLLQEELTKPTEPLNSAGPESLHQHHAKTEEAPSESGNQDAHSTSSEMLDQLLQEDARSGTGSNASGSGSGESGGSLGSGLGSNGTSTSHTGAVQNHMSMTLNVVWRELGTSTTK